MKTLTCFISCPGFWSLLNPPRPPDPAVSRPPLCCERKLTMGSLTLGFVRAYTSSPSVTTLMRFVVRIVFTLFGLIKLCTAGGLKLDVPDFLGDGFSSSIETQSLGYQPDCSQLERDARSFLRKPTHSVLGSQPIVRLFRVCRYRNRRCCAGCH